MDVSTAAHHREYMALYKERRRSAGLCVSCSNKSDAGDKCERCKERHRLRQREWRQRPEEKKKRCARQSVLKAVASGRLIKPDACEQCRTPGKVQAHHADHSRYLDVEWLCENCHAATHRKHQVAA